MSVNDNCGCGDSSKGNKYIRFVDNGLVVTEGSDTIFSPDSLKLSDWYQLIESYSYTNIKIESLGSYKSPLDIDVQFLMARIDWPSDALESEKILEFFLPLLTSRTETTIPAIIGVNAGPIIEKISINDVLVVNSYIDMDEFEIINPSIHTATVHLFWAT